MLTVRDANPKVQELATAEFATLRLRLLKIAARVVETTSAGVITGALIVTPKTGGLCRQIIALSIFSGITDQIVPLIFGFA